MLNGIELESFPYHKLNCIYRPEKVEKLFETNNIPTYTGIKAEF